jgi:hypothetical protein
MLKRMLLGALALLLMFGGPALAGKNNGGSLVVHIDNVLTYTSSGVYCNTTLPSTCETLVTENDDNAADHPVWFLAAFDPSSSPAVTAINFGLVSNIPVGQGYYTHWGMCPYGSLDLPDPGWPDGNAIGNTVAFMFPITSQIFPFYYFWVHGDHNLYMGTGVNPHNGTAQFCDDSSFPILDDVTGFGRVRWYEPGFNECPQPEQGACCFPNGDCRILTPGACGSEGGSYRGADSVCDPNPCPQPVPVRTVTWGAVKGAFRR